MLPSPAQSDRVYRFGPFEIAEREGELRKNGIRVKVQEQPLRVLLQLLENSGQIVTREELQQRLWPADTFVDFDVGLNSAIRKLRQALGDDADAPRYIETVAKRGYRFIAPMRPQEAAREEVAPQPKAETRHLSFFNRRVLYAAVVAAFLVGGLVAYLALRSSAPRLLTEQRVTSNPEEAPVIGAVVSPDGKYIAYADSTGVYFRQVDSGETHPINVPPGEEWVPTSWFPDSTHLLISVRTVVFGPERLSPERFSSEAHANLWKVSILGGSAQPVVEDATAGVVSPDGSQIAFYRGGSGFTPRELWLAQADGSNSHRVVVPDAQHAFISTVAWSPHGKRLAYVRMERPDRELWAIETLDLSTGSTRVVKVAGRVGPALTWGPDGRLFYGYQPEKKGERFSSVVYAICLNEDSGAATGGETQLTDGSGIISGMSMSRDGKRVVFWRDQLLAESYVTEYLEGSQKLAPIRRLTLDANSNMVTAWTPDSRSILFVSNRSGQFKLYRQGTEQTVPELVVDKERIVLARLAPDGKSLVCLLDTDVPHNAPRGIVLVPLDGNPPKTILTNPALSDIQCAREPSSLCLVSTVGPGGEVFRLNLQDGTLQKWTLPVKEDYNEWGLSPDGSTLALIMPGQKLVFMNTQDKSLREVPLPEWKRLIAIDWAPDSRGVYIPSRRADGSYVLLRVDRDGTPHVVLEGGKVPRFQWAIPAPDEKHVAVQAIAGENNVWMVENP